MKISGATTLHTPPPKVWAALHDPAVLAANIPGCERFSPAGPGTCRVTVTAAVASTQGTYTGEIRLTQAQEPAFFRLAATAAGAPGTVTATAHVQLAAAAGGTTQLSYTADATVTGLLAAAGQLLLASAAKKLIGEFLTTIDAALARSAPAPARARSVRGGGAAGVASPADAPTPGASGMTAGPPMVDGQPAGGLRARPPTGGFVPGVLAGAAATLAGMSLARWLRRRAR